MTNLTNQEAIYDYVISHIDEAISKEWIKVYYQPVVRALTGQLCSAESLSRWIDPEVGFLPPDKFIGALEDSKNIHKLDCFMVEIVCRDISNRLRNGLTACPVSVNFSRLDFIMCDMLKVVETAVAKYNIPRDYLHFEVTESMIAQDEELMKDVIDRFRTRGYEIWMDDFGSGYSSLTLLKDYSFDLLKLDMRFLSTMTEKSKEILRSTIGMAKKIGVKTLSEGVETREQAEFLKSIGCGKFQGYYYGKPQPLEDMLTHLAGKGITIEERQWREFYEAASINVVDLETPLQILEYDGNGFKTLFINEACKQQISLRTNDMDFFDKALYGSNSPLIGKFKLFAEKCINSKSIENFYFTDKGNYFFMKALCIGENEGKYLFKCRVTNISMDENTNERDRLDFRLRELNNLFEVVLLMNIKAKSTFPLLGGFIYMNDNKIKDLNATEAAQAFARSFIFPSEQNDFLEFMDFDTLAERIKQSGRSFIGMPFRVKQQDGSYKWRQVSLMSIPGTNGNEYLFAISEISNELAEAMDALCYLNFEHGNSGLDEVTIEYARIWQNLLSSSSMKFFWKDTNRRFRGVSKSFLEFYEIKSLDEIIGKTDEEMHWHVDDGPYQGDELDVIGKGKNVVNARGQCIVNGVVHNIICNKMPLYDKGEIIGLVGTFADVDQEIYRVNKLLNPSKLDNMTRLMNNKFFLNTMVDYAMQYNDAGRNYGYIMLHNANQKRIEETYGSKYGVKVIREIGEKIIEVIGQRAVAARTKEAYFGIIIYIDSKEKLQALTHELKENVESINQVDGKSVTIKCTAACLLRTEEGVKDETIYQMTIDMLDQQEES
jgi:EAL domain-containing protein (putative c-di-GMP-specific phosphodiesterase class I)/GGDEF domain-containing protein